MSGSVQVSNSQPIPFYVSRFPVLCTKGGNKNLQVTEYDSGHDPVSNTIGVNNDLANFAALKKTFRFKYSRNRNPV